jgi:acetolactate synthase I/II/III large subunit
VRLSGSQIIAQCLKAYGVEYVAGIPGHGAWVMLDALLEPESKIPFIQVFHEQSAVHLADGYYRAGGTPMAAVTSVGPGATNTIIGLATAFADSTSLLLLTGGPATHMRGHGVMQELERYHDNDFPKVTEPVTKRHYEATRVDQLPSVMHRAFNSMLTGRAGPVHVEVPMDVQAETAEVNVHDLSKRLPVGRVHPDPVAVERAAQLLSAATRPVIVVGGGAITADAAGEVHELAELLHIPVVTTWNGKGAFPEDHQLFAGSVGQTGTIPGNAIAARADLVLSVGCRFTDWSASSYRRGVSFSIPPAKLIHIDIDPHEIGKNYPAEVGVVADAKPALAAIVAAVGNASGASSAEREDLQELSDLKAKWEEQMAARRDSDESPLTSQRPLAELRRLLPRDGIVVVGSGNAQGAVKQTFPVYEPRTHLTSGSYSSMGWAVPAAIGAKLAQPERKVVSVLGDGDFLMTMQEIAVCVTNEIPVVFLVQNNAGYMSIRGGQRKIMDRHIGSEFNRRDGESYSPDFTAIARSFGLEAWRADTPDEVSQALKSALDSDAPAVVEVATSRSASGPFVPGWWDFPVPGYITDDRQDEYWRLRRDEQHL